MRKTALSLFVFFVFFIVKAQKGEVKLNILNTLVIGSIEVGYEHFIFESQSAGLELLINDRFSYSTEKGNRKYTTNSIQASYNFYTSYENNGSGWVVTPFFKYRFGNYEKKETVNEIPNTTVKTNMNSAILGLGIGHKWIFNGLAIGPYANIARNFSEKVNDEFSVIEFNAGISVGYRF